MYTILSGEIPFTEDLRYTKQQIIKAEYDFDDIIWSGISDSAKNLINSMLQLDPSKRISIDEALEHPWIKNNYIEHNKQSERYHRTSRYNILLVDPNEKIEI